MKSVVVSVSAVAMVSACALAQSTADVDPNAAAAPGPYAGGVDALGDVVDGPIDVQSQLPSGDLQVLGVEYAFGKYFVTGRNGGPPNQEISWFDLDGNYEGGILQTTTSPSWGGRDMASDEAAGELYVGAEGGELAVYTWDGSTLTYDRTITADHGGTVRGLARNPDTGNFYSADFSNDIFEFDASGAVVNQWFNPVASVYGLAWDCQNDTLWALHQVDTGGGAGDLVTATELEFDGAQWFPTGREFPGIDVNPAEREIAGGVDIGAHPDAPGQNSLIAMHQVEGSTLPQEGIVIYDIETEACESECYADCDGTQELDFFDFLCFQNEFSAGSAYADCDNNQEHDFFDFLCFQNEFSAGCL